MIPEDVEGARFEASSKSSFDSREQGGEVKFGFLENSCRDL